MKNQKFNLAFSSMAIIIICASLAGASTITPFHPVILVPGSGGNQLEARLTSDYKPSSILCNRKWWYPSKQKDDWFRLWFDLSVIFGPFTMCFAERMMLYYDSSSDDYRNADGVQTRVPHFGSIEGLRYLDPNLKQVSAYMEPLIKSLERIGYVDGDNLFGAPYDFRYGLAAEGHPSQVGTKYLLDLKHLIENASISNGGNPVILLSHSLGGLFVLQLLNRNPIAWRKQYVKHVVALSAPWGGTVKQMLTFASGYTLGIPFADPLLVRDEQRSSESNLWLMPAPKVFDKLSPLVVSRKATYSANDIGKFLQDIGIPDRIYPYEARILPLVNHLGAPEVPVTCIIGTGVSTPEKLIYGKHGFDKQPEIVYGDGDGTVNMVSLLALKSEWTDKRNQSLKIIKVSGVEHTSILKDDVALEKTITEINGINLDNTYSISRTKS